MEASLTNLNMNDFSHVILTYSISPKEVVAKWIGRFVDPAWTCQKS